MLLLKLVHCLRAGWVHELALVVANFLSSNSANPCCPLLSAYEEEWSTFFASRSKIILTSMTRSKTIEVQLFHFDQLRTVFNWQVFEDVASKDSMVSTTFAFVLVWCSSICLKRLWCHVTSFPVELLITNQCLSRRWCFKSLASFIDKLPQLIVMLRFSSWCRKFRVSMGSRSVRR